MTEARSEHEQRRQARGGRRHRCIGRGRAGHRARVRASAARTSACSPEGSEGLDGGRREVESLRRRGARCRRPTSPTTMQVEAAAAVVEDRSARSTCGSTTPWRPSSRRFIDTEPEEFKRATEVTYLGAVYGTMAALKRMTRARPGQDRAGRFRARLPRDPAAGRLLRREVRDPRLHRLDPHRAAARQEQGADHDGAAARRQHARSSTGAAPSSPTTRCPCHRSTSPRSPPRPSTGPRTTAGASCGSATARWRRSSRQVRAELLVDRYLAMTGFPGQQVKDMPVDGEREPATCSSRCSAMAATHGIFDAQAKTRSPQMWAATHRPLLAGALAGCRRGGRQRAARSVDERAGRRELASMRRTSCASTRCSPTASAASLVGPRGDFVWMCFPRWDSERSSPR